jgi:hypothetical protein
MPDEAIIEGLRASLWRLVVGIKPEFPISSRLGPKHLTIFDESHRSITHEYRQPSRLSASPGSRRAHLVP